MVNIKHICNDCKQIGIITIHQTLHSFPKLNWYKSFQCSFCSSALEIDGIGFPPEEIRQLIIKDEGEYKLVVNSVKLKNKVKLLKIIHQILPLSLKQLLTLKKTFPNMVSGTNIEMKWLKKHLFNEGIKSSIEPIHPSQDNQVIAVLNKNYRNKLCFHSLDSVIL